MLGNVCARAYSNAVYVKHIRTFGSNTCQMLDGSENVFRVMLMAKYRFTEITFSLFVNDGRMACEKSFY